MRMGLSSFADSTHSNQSLLHCQCLYQAAVPTSLCFHAIIHISRLGTSCTQYPHSHADAMKTMNRLRRIQYHSHETGRMNGIAHKRTHISSYHLSSIIVSRRKFVIFHSHLLASSTHHVFFNVVLSSVRSQ